MRSVGRHFSGPDGTIERAVPDGLGDVQRLDRVDPLEVGHGARHAEDLVVRPGREPELFHRTFEDRQGLRPEWAILADLPGSHAAVDAGSAMSEALRLACAGLLDLVEEL